MEAMMNFTVNLSATRQDGRLFLRQETPFRVIMFTLIAFPLCVITCIWQVLLFIVVLRQKTQFSGAKLLILHQLVTESQLTMIYWPIYLIIFVASQYDHRVSAAFCTHYMLAYMTTMTAGLWGLFLLAFNRFLAIAVPHSYRKWSQPTLNLGLIIAVWSIGFFDHLYFYMGGDGGFGPTPPFGHCNFLKFTTSAVIANVFNTYLPLSLCGFVYLLLFIKVVADNRSRQVGNTASDLSTQLVQTARRIRLAQLMFGMTLVHTLCFSSIPIWQSFFRFKKGFPDDPMAGPWIRQLFCAGYLSTPVLFFSMNKECREGCRRIFSKSPVADIALQRQSTKPSNDL